MKVLILLLLLFSGLAKAQSLPTIFEQHAVMTMTKGKGEASFQFEVNDPESSDAFLTLEQETPHPLVTEVSLNGKAVLIGHGSFTAAPVTLRSANAVKVKALGSKAGAIRVRVISTEGLSALGPPLVFPINKNSRVVFKNVVAPAAGEYLVKVEADAKSLLPSVFSQVHLNGERIFSLTEMIYLFKGAIYKVVDLSETNEVSVRGPHKSSFRVTILRNSPPGGVDLSRGTLRFANLNSNAFNSRSIPIQVDALGVNLATDTSEFEVKVNDEDIASNMLHVSGNRLTIPPVLRNGENLIHVAALDSEGRALAIEGRFWAGRHRVTVNVVDSQTLESVEAESLELSTIEGPLFTATQSQRGSIFVFENVPAMPFRLLGKSGNGVGVVRQAESVPVDLEFTLLMDIRSFEAQAVSARSLVTVPYRHADIVIPGPIAINQRVNLGIDVARYPDSGFSWQSVVNPDGTIGAVRDPYVSGYSMVLIPVPLGAQGRLSLEMVLDISNDPQTPDRAGLGAYTGFAGGFAVSATGSIGLDVPGYSITPSWESANRTETVTMSVAPGTAYVAIWIHSLRYHNVSAPLNILRSLQFSSGMIDDFKLLDHDPEFYKISSYKRVLDSISFLSVDVVGARNGVSAKAVPVWAEVKVSPGAGDRVSNIFLMASQNGQDRFAIPLSVHGRAKLSEYLQTSARGQDLLLSSVEFEGLYVTGVEPLFEIPANTTTGSLQVGQRLGVNLRLVVQTELGKELIKAYTPASRPDGKLGILLDYKRPERFSILRDDKAGGDGWAKPSTLTRVYSIRDTAIAMGLKFQVNDLSSAHGGQFAIHDSHREGISADLRIDGFLQKTDDTDPNLEPTVEAAENLILLVDRMDSSVRQRIQTIYITKNANFEDALTRLRNNPPFGAPLKGAGLYTHKKGHTDHFHIEFQRAGSDD